MKKKILITGAQGLIGSVLLEKIVEENNFQIFSIIQPSIELKINQVIYLEHDLLNPLPEKYHYFDVMLLVDLTQNEYRFYLQE